MKKKKRYATIFVVLSSVVLFVLFCLFLSDNENFEFVPFVLGGYLVCGLFVVKTIFSQN